MKQKELKEIVNYNEDTGIFTRRKSGELAGCDSHGYLVFSINDTLHRAHRLAWLYVYGEMPNGNIDHINQNRQDNRISNLRIADHVENGRNTKKHKNNKSGMMGVSWREDKKSWRAYITINRKQIGLGHFKSRYFACMARKFAESQYGFHANHGMA